MIKKHYPLSACLLVFLFFLPQMMVGEEIFDVPEILKDNVMFWKKIYTEVSLTEGVIHDNEYPMIIYRLISLANRTGKTRKGYLQENMAAVERILETMNNKSPDQWTGIECQIRDLFKQYANLDALKDAASRLRFQLGQKERFKEGLERAAAYMPFIMATFEKMNIPKRVAYLPHVESSFNIEARSRVGAAGMWQFMRGTGKLFHLKMDSKIDERHDPIRSTLAAAQLLIKNYENLKSWPLAITAYNHGPASIKRAVLETGSRNLGVIIEKYKNRRFKFASKNFYGCFIAASEIASQPEKYFSNLNLHPQLKFNEIQIRNSLAPQKLAKQLGVSQDNLKKLNPALRPVLFKRQLPIPTPYVLRIPTSRATEKAAFSAADSGADKDN
ncbi:MAG: lytic transglycosylase domain-containing protein [Candidatus Omnitrophota bacterium]